MHQPMDDLEPETPPRRMTTLGILIVTAILAAAMAVVIGEM